jgi:single-strand DNA-binding protein
VEIQYTAKGTPIYCFSIANNLSRFVNESWVKEPNFFYFRLLGKRWEGISTWLIKGQLVSILGELEQNRWEKDGKQRSYLKVAIKDIQPLRGSPAEKATCQAPEEDGSPADTDTFSKNETEPVPGDEIEEETNK